ncbi:MAG: pyridoxamine 5'-phosphate oxidase family protein [Nitrososphaerales archaeon]
MPLITPAVYLLDGDNQFTAIEYEETKLKNLKENPKVSFLVDDHHLKKGLMIRTRATTLALGSQEPLSYCLFIYPTFLATFEKYDSLAFHWSEAGLENALIIFVSSSSR